MFIIIFSLIIMILTYKRYDYEYKKYFILFMIIHIPILILVTTYGFILDPQNEGFIGPKNDQYTYLKHFLFFSSQYDFPFFDLEYLVINSNIRNGYIFTLIHTTFLPIASIEVAVILTRLIIFSIYYFIFLYAYKISKTIILPANQKFFIIFIIFSPTLLGRFLPLTRDSFILLFFMMFIYYFFRNNFFKIFISIILLGFFRPHFGIMIAIAYFYFILYSKVIKEKYLLFFTLNLIFVFILGNYLNFSLPGGSERYFFETFTQYSNEIIYNYFLSLISLTFLNLDSQFYSFSLTGIILMRIATFDFVLIHFIFTFNLLKKEFYDEYVIFILSLLLLYVIMYTYAIQFSTKGMYSINFRSLIPFSIFFLIILLRKYKVAIPMIKFGKKILYGGINV